MPNGTNFFRGGTVSRLRDLNGISALFLIQYAVYLPEASVHILHADDIAGIDRSVCSFELRKYGVRDWSRMKVSGIITMLFELI